MHRKTLTSILGLSLLLAPGVAAAAEDDDVAILFGKVEYEKNCAVCHGRGGTGGGPMSDYFKQAPPDLTRVAASRGGKFPTTEIYQIIDGRRGLRGHGGSQMPVWGDAYRVTVEQELFDKNVPHDLNPEFNVHARILSLVYYLESVQTE